MDYKIIPVGRAKDIRGQKFGRLTVLERVEDFNKGGNARWLCKCECGSETLVYGNDLVRPNQPTRSCGCGRTECLVGNRYGRLTVVRETKKRSGSNVVRECVCDCGNTCFVSGDKLKNGNTRSCGCLATEIGRKLGKARKKDLINFRFGRLKVIADTGKRASGNDVIWRCKCDCGTIVEVSSPNLQTNTRSCGCLQKEIIASIGRTYSGEKHPMYNPDLTNEERMLKRKPLGNKLNKWRNDVFGRDGYTCKCCGEKASGKLNAHHLNSWDSFPEERFDIDNGITLCEGCHKTFHSEYGYGNNTKEQFWEFVNEYKEALTG